MQNKKQIAAGVLPVCSFTGRILLIRRGFDQDGPGKWACFGGVFENDLDSDPKACAKREFKEESRFSGSYKISKMPLDVTVTNHLDFYTFIGVFQKEFIPDIESEGEAVDYGWFYPDQTPDDLLLGFKETLNTKTQTIKEIIAFYSEIN